MVLEPWQERLQNCFGVCAPPRALFYAFDAALRFELSGDRELDAPIGRFLQAHQRARALARFAFRNSQSLYAVSASWGNDQGPGSDLQDLRAVLPTLNPEEPSFKETEDEEDPFDPVVAYWYVNQIGAPAGTRDQKMEELLWLALASDLGIRPAAIGSKTWLVDFDNAIILHAYDDRGLDIVAMDAQVLQPVYDTFKAWLLDYDRQKMDRVFHSA